MMKKRIFALLLSMALMVNMFLPGTVAAELDETANSTAQELICGKTEHIHEDSCWVTVCAECGQQNGHGENCSYGVQPVEEPLTETEFIAFAGTFKESVVTLYRNLGATSGSEHNSADIGGFMVIAEECDVSGIMWYKLDFESSLWDSRGYCYVLADSVIKTTVEPEVPDEPADPNACECENPPENIANHADGCPRKEYIKSLVEGKTAEEIYKIWETYDKITQNDILNYLKVYDEGRFEELDELMRVPENTQILTDGTKLISDVPIIAIETEEAKQAALESALSSLSDNEKGIFDSVIKYLDIDSESDSATITISGIDEASVGDKVVVLHFLDSITAIEEAAACPIPILNKIKTNSEVLSEERAAAQAYSGEADTVYYRYEYATVNEDRTITFLTRSFSTFGLGKARSGNQPSLLRDDLVANGIEDLSVVEFPATLYKYTADIFNKNGNFDFKGPNNGVWPNEAYISNAGVAVFVNNASDDNETAKQGIMQSTTKNGLPQLALVDTGKTYVFDSTTNGKTVYSNVPFEFVYDKSTGYYTYNSYLSHAQFNQSTQRVELYSQTLGAYETSNGGAFFFNDIYQATVNAGSPHVSIDQYQEKLYDTSLATRCDYVATTDGYNAKDLNTHFGIQLDYMFYLPQDKQVNGEDIVFNFTGDDDLWVFIDGQLVLDIGGGHKPVMGQINLTDATSYVSNVSQWKNGTTQQLGEVNLSNISALANLEEDAMHRIQVFYLERMSWGSNCFISFNLPAFPEADVRVTKEVVADDGEELTTIPDEEYQFKLYVSKKGGAFEASANTSYTVGGKSFTTGADGIFKLKQGQTAVFEGISRYYDDTLTPTEVYVEEILGNESSYVYTQADISVGGAVTNVTSPTGTIQAATSEIPYMGELEYKFTNRIQTEPLAVEKQVAGGADGLADPNQEFEFNLQFTKLVAAGTVVAQKGNVEQSFTMGDDGKITFKLKQGESITFPRIPMGMTYTLMENNAGTGFHTPTYEHRVGSNAVSSGKLPFDTAVHFELRNGGRNEIIVRNKQLHSLTIKKMGADMQIDPNQTFIFHVSGPGNLEMDVAIVGNGSVTIPDLIYGEYTITEDVNWSWRYDPSQNPQTVVLDTNKNVEFVNDREEKKWLDGNSWCRNIFKSTEIEKDTLPNNLRKEADE